MTHEHNHPADLPEMDPKRSAEIRALLIRTVAGTPRPRVARLSRPAFALAASVALVAAGCLGAGTVLTIEQVTSGNTLVAQSADSSGQDNTAEVSAATESSPAGLSPVLMLNGETGYVYDIDLYSFHGMSAAGPQSLQGEALDAPVGDSDLLPDEAGPPSRRVPVYLADGVTVIGYVELWAVAR